MNTINARLTVSMAAILAIASLITYGVINGYHHDIELMLTVILVRAAAGLGVGIATAIGWWIVSLVIRRRAGGLHVFITLALTAASIVMTVTVLINLLLPN